MLLTWHSYSKFKYSNDIFPFVVPNNLLSDTNIDLHLWQSRGPVFAKYGRLTDHDIDVIVASRTMGSNTCHLPFHKISYFCSKLEVGDIVMTGDKSSSADVIIKVGETQFIECQFKSGKQRLTLSHVNLEINKSITEHSQFKSIFVIFCVSGVKYDHEGTKYNKKNIKVIVPSKDELVSFFGDESMLSYFMEK